MNEIKQDITSPDFWKHLASSSKGNKVNRKCMTASCWDKAADDYDDLESCRDYLNQVESVVTILKDSGALNERASVIDIASGTGTYAVRFAGLCRSILCVDISSRMLEKLQAKCNDLGINNIETVQSDWHAFNPGKYDLVFCSMSPLLKDMDTVDSFIDCSRRYVAFVTWAGIRENEALNELGSKILRRKPGKHASDMNVLFNYLYSKGLAPELHFSRGCWEKRRSVSKQIKNLIWRLEMYRPLDEPEKKMVEEYVKERAKDGMMTVTSRVRTVLMLIDKQADVFGC